MTADNNRVDCYKCKYFSVSWDPKQPHSCKVFGFKSRYLPSLVVYQSTGTACEGFEKKGDPKKPQ